MTSLAGSGFKMEEDYLIINIVESFVFYNASTLLICGNEWLDTNKLKIQTTGMATLKILKIKI